MYEGSFILVMADGLWDFLTFIGVFSGCFPRIVAFYSKIWYNLTPNELYHEEPKLCDTLCFLLVEWAVLRIFCAVHGLFLLCTMSYFVEILFTFNQTQYHSSIRTETAVHLLLKGAILFCIFSKL